MRPPPAKKYKDLCATSRGLYPPYSLPRAHYMHLSAGHATVHIHGTRGAGRPEDRRHSAPRGRVRATMDSMAAHVGPRISFGDAPRVLTLITGIVIVSPRGCRVRRRRRGQRLPCRNPRKKSTKANQYCQARYLLRLCGVRIPQHIAGSSALCKRHSTPEVNYNIIVLTPLPR